MPYRITVLLGGLLLLFSLPLTGKGKGDVPKRNVRYLSMYGHPSDRAREREMIDRFEEEFPGFTVLYEPIPYEDYDQTLVSYFASGLSVPDLLTVDAGYWVTRLIRQGGAADLAPFFREEGAGIPLYREYSYNQEHLYFIPSYRYGWGIYYKPSVFEQHELEIPADYENFFALCENLLSRDLSPLAIGTEYPWTGTVWFEYLNLRLNGPDFHKSLLDGSIPYTDSRVQNVFFRWAELIDQGYFLDSSEEVTWIEALEFFSNDQSVLYLMGDFLKDALHPAAREDLGCFSFPAFDLSIPRGEIAPSEGFLVPEEGGDTGGGAALLKHFIGEGHAGCLPAFSPGEEEGILTGKIINQAEFLFQPFEKEVHPALAIEAETVFREFWHSHSLERIGEYTRLLEETRGQIQADPEVKSLPAP